jgi:hypothetical protein
MVKVRGREETGRVRVGLVEPMTGVVGMDDVRVTKAGAKAGGANDR